MSNSRSKKILRQLAASNTSSVTPEASSNIQVIAPENSSFLDEL